MSRQNESNIQPDEIPSYENVRIAEVAMELMSLGSPGDEAFRRAVDDAENHTLRFCEKCRDSTPHRADMCVWCVARSKRPEE